LENTFLLGNNFGLFDLRKIVFKYAKSDHNYDRMTNCLILKFEDGK